MWSANFAVCACRIASAKASAVYSLTRSRSLQSSQLPQFFDVTTLHPMTDASNRMPGAASKEDGHTTVLASHHAEEIRARPYEPVVCGGGKRLREFAHDVN